MRSLFELISKYRSDVINIPMIALGAMIFTLFMYIFLNKRKWIKYIPGVVGVLVATVFLVQGYFELLTDTGLDFIDMSIKIYVFGFAVIFFSIILDIIDSFGKGISKIIRNKKNKRLAQKQKKELMKKTPVNKVESKPVEKPVEKPVAQKEVKEKVGVASSRKVNRPADIKNTKSAKIIKK